MEYKYLLQNKFGKFLKFEYNIFNTADIAEATAYEYIDDIEMDYNYLKGIVNDFQVPFRVIKVDENGKFIRIVLFENLYKEVMENDF